MRKIKNAEKLLLDLLYRLEEDPYLVFSVAEFVKNMELFSDYAGADVLPEDFSAVTYLLLNLDIYDKNIDPWGHYLNSGKKEGRQF